MKSFLQFCIVTLAFLVVSCDSADRKANNGQPSANSAGTPVASSANSSPAPKPAEPKLEGMYWTLTSATDAQNKPIKMPTNIPDKPVVFTFSDAMLNIEGPCNLLSGSYTGGSGSAPLVIGPLRRTLRGCEPAVMDAEKKLTMMLSGPLQVTLEGGSAPKMRLVNSAKETLSFDGRPTPESLYGPAKIIFMEVDAKRVPCQNPNGEKTCLQVRDRFFDEKGLQSAPPGEWRPLYEKIEGYTHTEGQRNVIRVKSFSPPNSGSNIYVLDLVVETETVK
jgi:heat shock protein HslJ